MDWQEETVQMLKAIRSRRNLKTLYKMTRMFYKKKRRSKMKYRKAICRMLEKIENERLLKYVYRIVKDIFETGK